MSAERSHDPRVSLHSVLGGLPSTRDDAWRKRLLEALLSSYQSLEKPHYGFVARRHKSPPEALLTEIASGSSVKDLTDINCEVSWKFELARGDAHLDLIISMVGPYVVVLRHGPSGLRTPITSAVECQSSLERDVLGALHRHRFEVLSESEYRTPIRMNIYDVSEAYRCLYQALFLPEDWMPTPA